MPATPTNCFICKNYWPGKGPICDQCMANYQHTHPQFYAQHQKQYAPLKVCQFCGAQGHEQADCLDWKLKVQQAAIAYAAQLAQTQAAQAAACKQAQHAYNYGGTMTGRRRRSKPYVNPRRVYSNYETGPKLLYCSTCHQNQRAESKAGSICLNCKTLIRKQCRNCDSHETHGIGGDGMQFIECNDCLFIE